MAYDEGIRNGPGGTSYISTAAQPGLTEDSEHVMAATNVDRGDTPAQWNAVDPPTRIGMWKGVDQSSGHTDEHINVISPFDSGPNRWLQT